VRANTFHVYPFPANQVESHSYSQVLKGCNGGLDLVQAGNDNGSNGLDDSN